MIVWAGYGGGANLGYIDYLNTGGRYCVLDCTASDWYRDADGDGYGASGLPRSARAQPAGYVAVSGDCNDTNAAAHPGASEVCGDGLDNDCDGMTDPSSPMGIVSLQVGELAAGTVRVTWNTFPGPLGYDVVRGSLTVLQSSHGDFSAAIGACLANDTPLASLEDAVVPDPADGFWYLVRAWNCGGNGSYDSGAVAQQGSRDAEIAASAATCP